MLNSSATETTKSNQITFEDFQNAIESKDVTKMKNILESVDENKVLKSVLQHKNGWTPLHRALWTENLDMVNILLDSQLSKKKLKIHDYSEVPYLNLDTQKENLDMLNLLLDSNLSKETLKIQDMFGYTPLHRAVDEQNLEIVNLLLDLDKSKETLKIQNYDGNTPLHISSVNNRINIFFLLLENDFNFEKTLQLKNKYDKTPLECCKNSETKQKLIKIIEEKRKRYELENKIEFDKNNKKLSTEKEENNQTLDQNSNSTENTENMKILIKKMIEKQTKMELKLAEYEKKQFESEKKQFEAEKKQIEAEKKQIESEKKYLESERKNLESEKKLAELLRNL